jgi:hypothetical protein
MWLYMYFYFVKVTCFFKILIYKKIHKHNNYSFFYLKWGVFFLIFFIIKLIKLEINMILEVETITLLYAWLHFDLYICCVLIKLLCFDVMKLIYIYSYVVCFVCLNVSIAITNIGVLYNVAPNMNWSVYTLIGRIPTNLVLNFVILWRYHGSLSMFTWMTKLFTML